MYFAIMSTDVPNSLPLRLPVRDQHLARLQALNEDGRLLLAGPHQANDDAEQAQPAFTGSFVVAQFDSLSAAQDWADADPYIKAGDQAQVVVKPFLAGLP